MLQASVVRKIQHEVPLIPSEHPEDLEVEEDSRLPAAVVSRPGAALRLALCVLFDELGE
jgi:hypothetical protein